MPPLPPRSRPLPGTRPSSGRWLYQVLDQRALPWKILLRSIPDADTAALAISAMWVRGAPLIGIVGAYGLALALNRNASDASLAEAQRKLVTTRPTAANLKWALERVRETVTPLPPAARAAAAWQTADAVSREDGEINHALGLAGLELYRRWPGASQGRCR